MGRQNYVYIGPNVPQIGLKRNTLFRGNEPPAKLRELIQKRPVLSALFVSTAALSQAERSLKIKGAVEHTAQKEMAEIVKTLPR
jgi:hypothetical protein